MSKEKSVERITRAHMISLASYSLRVRRKQAPDEFEKFGEFTGGKTMLDFLHSFFSSLQKSDELDEETMSLLRARRVKRDEWSVWGLVASGDFGYAADLVDVSTMEKSYRRNTTDAELYPFFFLINAPDSSDRATFIFQRHGNRSMYTELVKRLREAFDEQYPDYTLNLRRHVPKEIVDSLLKGQIRTIQVTQYHLSDDIADRVKYDGKRADISEVQITLKAKRKGFLKRPSWLDKIIKSTGNLVEIAEEVNDVAGRVRVWTSYNGKSRMVDFKNFESIAPYLDVTSKVKIGADGHPTFESIEREARLLLSELLAEMG